MPSIADAYVELHVDGDNIEGEVRKEIKNSEGPAGKESDKVGKSLGARMASGFLSGFATKMKSGGSKAGKEIQKAFKGFSPKGLMIPALAAAIPLLTSTLSALSGALVAFTGAVVQAGTSSFALVGIVGSLIQAKLTLKLATGGLAAALKGEEGAMAKLAPAAQELVKSIKGLGPEWEATRKAVQGAAFAGLAPILDKIGRVSLPVLKTGLTGTGTVLNRLFKDLGGFATSEFFVRKFGQALKGNNAILDTLRKAAVPLLRGILNVFTALQPSGKRLAGTIVGIAKAFAQWSSGKAAAESIRAFMDRAFGSAKNLFGIVKNLGVTLYNVFSAATPAGGGLLKTLNDLTKRLAEFTSLASTKNAIAEWAQTGIQVSGKLFSVLGKVGKMLLPLFNPDIAGGFLKIFESVMPTILSIVKVLQTALAPVLEAIGSAFAKNGPKFAGLFKALSPLLIGLGAVIGEIISQALNMLGTIASVITPIVKVIAGVLGPVMVKFAPVIAFLILAFTNWGSVLVKLVPFIGKFIAPLVKLSEYLYTKVMPSVALLGKVVGKTFGFIGKIIGTTVRFVGKGVQLYFTLISRVISLAMRVVMTVVKVAWSVIKAVVLPVVRVIAKAVQTYFGIIRKVITTVVNVVKAVVTRGFQGIRAVVGAVMRVIVGIIRGAWGIVKNITTTVGKVLKDTVGRAMSGIWEAVSKGFGRVVDFVKGIPGKIRDLGANFLEAGRSLGKKVIDGIWNGLKAAGGFAGDLASSIKSAINSALHLPFTIKGPGPLPDFTIPKFAGGTPYAPGGLALVGERGPEIVNVPRGSRVHTATQTAAMMGKAGPTYQIDHLEVNNPRPEPPSNLPRTLSNLNFLLGV